MGRVTLPETDGFGREGRLAEEPPELRPLLTFVDTRAQACSLTSWLALLLAPSPLEGAWAGSAIPHWAGLPHPQPLGLWATRGSHSTGHLLVCEFKRQERQISSAGCLGGA